MHQELNGQISELQELQPSSRSSWTQNNPSSPLFQNYGHFQTLVHHHAANSQKQLTNYQLHYLVYSQQKIQDPYSKCYLSKFVATVMDYNNLSYTKILQLQKKEEKIQRIKNNKRKQREKIDTLSRSQSQQDNSVVSNNESISKIQNLISIYLNEAERILQYAASCGKVINRKLIITILNNQACYYQKLWQLEKACSYIQATVLNMQQWGQQSHWSQLNRSHHSNQIQQQTKAFEKFSFKKEGQKKASCAQYSTKVQVKYEQTLPQKLAKNYQLKSKSHKQNCDLQFKFTCKKDIANHISKMCQLSMYYLQYCSLCGQLTNHIKAIEAARKVITKMKKVININKYYFLNSRQCHIQSQICDSSFNTLDFNKKKFIIGLSQIEQNIQKNLVQESIQNFRQTARYYLKQRQKYITKQSQNGKKLKKNLINMFHKINKTQFLKRKLKKQQTKIQENQSLAQIQKIKQEFFNFTIGNILQVKPKLYRHVQSDLTSKEKSEGSIKVQSSISKSPQVQTQTQANSPFSFQFIFTKALLLSTGYFTLATELRLLAAKQQVVQGERFQSKFYKQSEIYHLTAIIIISIYVPIDILYLKQLVTSYQNYYVKQISPIDEMQSNEYGNGPNSFNSVSNHNNSKDKLILNNNFDKMGIFPYYQKSKEIALVEKKQQQKQDSIDKKQKEKLAKKSKSKSKSSKSKSFKKGFGDQYIPKSQKKLNKKNKPFKNTFKQKCNNLKTSRQKKANDVPYISVANKQRQRQTHYVNKNSLTQKKKTLSHSILIKGQRLSLNSQSNKYNHLLNKISRSTNMLTEKSKSLSNGIKYHKNSSLNSHNQKISQFHKDRQTFSKEIESKRKKKNRKNSKQLKFQYKKRCQYKLNKKSPKKQNSSSKMISKSKSKQKSKAKDPNNYKLSQYNQRKLMSLRLPTPQQGAIIQKNHIIDQLSKRIQLTKKKQQNLQSYYDDKKELKLGKKGNKKCKNQNAAILSNSLSKKGSSFKSGKITKESPKIVRFKKIIAAV